MKKDMKEIWMPMATDHRLHFRDEDGKRYKLVLERKPAFFNHIDEPYTNYLTLVEYDPCRDEDGWDKDV